MPLPAITHHGARQCHARAKHSSTGCQNPAAYGCSTCRVHGARKPGTIKRGAAHPAYRHGDETLEAKAARSAQLAELRDIEALMLATGTLAGPRWRGRKPRAPG
jgi:hypothetical protein